MLQSFPRWWWWWSTRDQKKNEWKWEIIIITSVWPKIVMSRCPYLLSIVNICSVLFRFWFIRHLHIHIMLILVHKSIKIGEKEEEKFPIVIVKAFTFFLFTGNIFDIVVCVLLALSIFFDFYFSFVQTAIDCEKIGKNKTYESVTNWLQSMQSINQSKWSIDRMIDWSVKVSQVNIVKKKNSSFFHSRCKIKKKEKTNISL